MKKNKILRIKENSSNFKYVYNKSKKPVKDEQFIEWINSLAIPPAWDKVKISSNKNKKVLASGRDSKNRKQYIYNPKWVEKREKEKFDRILKFADALPTMRERTEKDLKRKKLGKRKVLACMVRLLDNAYFRAGSKKYAKENNTYGLTTLRSKHLEIKKNCIEFEYTGKSGTKQHKEIKNKKLINVIKQLDQISGFEIFKFFDQNDEKHYVTREMLNRYIKRTMGEEFTAKDFRTWAGTFLAATILNKLGIANKKNLVKKNILNAIDEVATILGNTPNVAKSSYIDPRVLKGYENGVTIKEYINELKSEVKKNDLNVLERGVYEMISTIN